MNVQVSNTSIARISYLRQIQTGLTQLRGISMCCQKVFLSLMCFALLIGLQKTRKLYLLCIVDLVRTKIEEEEEEEYIYVPDININTLRLLNINI